VLTAAPWVEGVTEEVERERRKKSRFPNVPGFAKV
jgi:hypothetical protein